MKFLLLGLGAVAIMTQGCVARSDEPAAAPSTMQTLDGVWEIEEKPPHLQF